MSSNSKTVRNPFHAGSWYSDDATKLSSQLQGWIKTASESKVIPPKVLTRALIGPHAGYRYSGPSAAFSYQALADSKSRIKRIFLFGPSHHEPFDGCALPSDKIESYATPIGDISLDLEVIESLSKDHKHFQRLSKRADESEHSLEMHLPYIYHCMQGQDFKLVPVMVGHLSSGSEEAYGEIFAPFLDDESNFFIISTDFCHWGKRFSYTQYDKNQASDIYKYITLLDKRGMDAIETGKASEFRNYLKETKNTICGRNPILIFLSITQKTKTNITTKFVHYTQSSKCLSIDDSSVSYAAAISYSQEN